MTAGAAPPTTRRGELAAIAMLAGRTYARYAIPLTLLAGAALAPWLLLALRTPPPKDLAGAKSMLRLAWLLAVTAWIGQLALVGAVAPLVRAVDAEARLSQLRALGRGALHLVRAVIPCATATAAIAIGGLALALPGLLLLCLLATTGAEASRGVPGALVASAALARRHLPLAAALVFALLALDLAIPYASQAFALAPIPKKPNPAQLAAYHRHVQIVACALAISSPWLASLIAAFHARATTTTTR